MKNYYARAVADAKVELFLIGIKVNPELIEHWKDKLTFSEPSWWRHKIEQGHSFMVQEATNVGIAFGVRPSDGITEIYFLTNISDEWGNRVDCSHEVVKAELSKIYGFDETSFTSIDELVKLGLLKTSLTGLVEDWN